MGVGVAEGEGVVGWDGGGVGGGWFRERWIV